MSEEITLRIRTTKTETLTYRPDRNFHGDKPLIDIARDDVKDIVNHEVRPEDLDDVYSESQSQYEVDIVDLVHDTTVWDSDDEDEG